MNIVFDQSFYKSLDKLRNAGTKERVAALIGQIEAAENLSQIPGLRKMEGFKTFYRIRLGDYRVGVELEADLMVRFIIIAHRKEIYRFFP